MIKTLQISNKRVGSTFLQNTLNSHPVILSIGEIFGVSYNDNGKEVDGIPVFKSCNIPKGQYMKWVHDKNDITNIKIMYNQMMRWDLNDYILDKNFNIIHLMRRNHFRRVMSQLIEGYSLKGLNDIENDKIILEIEKSIQNETLFRQKLSLTQGKYIELYYEDIIGDTIGDKTYLSEYTNFELCNMFEVKNIPMFSLTKKKNTQERILDNLKDLDGLKKIFKEKEWEWL